ncbi:MAG TPA: ABC transporter permease [Bryobacteraceae bacterium]|nr:ABC transporter permease [Bryobacteraceae bacterium]
MSDFRYAIRTLGRTPTFTLIAIGTIALGIAANVTVFSFVDAVYLRELPVKDSGRLVRVLGKDHRSDARFFSYPAFQYLRDHSLTLDQVVAHYSTAPLYVSTGNHTSELQGAVVSANYFPTLGVAPYLGRFFEVSEDATPDRDAVAVISYGLWRSWFAADPGVIGKTITVNRRKFAVIGVAPQSFTGIEVGYEPNQLWMPAMMLHTGYRWCDALQDAECTPLEILGRLRVGKTGREATAEVEALMGRFAASNPGKDIASSAWATPATGARIGDQKGNLEIARLLATAAAALLLIACVNLAGLMVARGAGRAKEIALRLSLGAGRARILRQLLTESVVLSAVGGALGLMLSLWTARLLMSYFSGTSSDGSPFYDVDPNLRTIAYAAALSLLTGVLFGVLPALQAARQDTAPTLRENGGGKGAVRTVLVATQIALSLALLVGAALVARSVAHLEAGQNFDPRNVALLRLRPLLVNYSSAQAQQFTREVIRRLESFPGVTSVSLTNGGSGYVWGTGRKLSMSLPGQERSPKEAQGVVNAQEIGPRYFETLRIPFVAGRDFNDHDLPASPRVAIVNESLAATTWPGHAATGQILILNNSPYRVVGVVKDSQFRSGLMPRLPMAFIPFWQNNLDPQIDSRMCVRVAGDPELALPRLKEAIARINPDVPITEMSPLMTQIRGEFVTVALARTVLVSAAGLALLLTAIGLYGILAFVVNKQTREIGIRMAVGAQPAQVLGYFLKQGLRLAVIGCGLGVVLALGTTRLLAAFLYAVPTRDPLSFIAGAGVLLMVAAVAAYVPSRRAASVDPMIALRYD